MGTFPSKPIVSLNKEGLVDFIWVRLLASW
jgi:hypothetical protein